MNVLLGTHEVKTGVLNTQRGELTICSAQTQELQSKGNFSATISMHRRKKRDLKHSNKAFTSYFKIIKYFKLLLQARITCSLLKNEPPLYTKVLKTRKSENPTYNPYRLHFYLLLPLTITYLLFRGRWTGQQKAGRSSER